MVSQTLCSCAPHCFKFQRRLDLTTNMRQCLRDLYLPGDVECHSQLLRAIEVVSKELKSPRAGDFPEALALLRVLDPWGIYIAVYTRP